VPGDAGLPVLEFVFVTETPRVETGDVSVPPEGVTVIGPSVVPSFVFVKMTVGVPTNPVPERVSAVAVGVAVSTAPGTLIDETVGAAYTMNAFVSSPYLGCPSP